MFVVFSRADVRWRTAEDGDFVVSFVRMRPRGKLADTAEPGGAQQRTHWGPVDGQNR
jgi:hypothetical protein